MRRNMFDYDVSNLQFILIILIGSLLVIGSWAFILIPILEALVTSNSTALIIMGFIYGFYGSRAVFDAALAWTENRNR